MTNTPEIDLALKALKLKMDKCITGRISYDLFEAQSLLNAIQDQKETQILLIDTLKAAQKYILTAPTKGLLNEGPMRERIKEALAQAESV